MLPARASASQRHAADELVRFVERMTGVRLPVTDDAAPRPARAILLGKTEAGLGDDGFRLKVKGDTLEIFGSPVRGTLYGVYELLEKYGGCRWYSSWTEVVPRLDAFAVPRDLDDRQVPAIPHREPFWFDMFNGDFAARNKANGPAMRLGERHGGSCARFGKRLGNCHTLQHLLPSSVYGKSHPEYYALRGGHRVIGNGDDNFTVQPCLTNPDVLRIVTSNVLAHIARDPDAAYFGVSQNDNLKYCECPNCAAVDAEEESHAGTMIRFVNAVAEAVDRAYPGKIVETLAYTYTRKPPKLTKPRANVMPCVCSYECDFSRSFDESRYPANVSFVDDIRGWSAISQKLYVWDYVTDFGNYPAPMANVYALQGNVKFMRDNGATAYFAQGDRQGSHAGFSDLKAWLLAKWMWNPELPMKPLLDDFFAGCYGPAAPYVRDYFEKVHACTRAYTAGSPDRALLCEPPGANKGVPADYWDEAGRLMDRALAVVAGREPYDFNVRFVRFGIDYMRLDAARTLMAPVVDLRGSTVPASVAEDVGATARRALAFLEECPTIRLCSNANRQMAVVAAWKQLANRTPPRTDGVMEDGFIAFDPERRVRRVDDAAAADGSALRFANPVPRWSSATMLTSVAFRPGGRYRLQVRVRLDAPVGRTGVMLTAGIYDSKAKCHRAAISVRAEELTTSYAEFVSEPFESDKLCEGSYLYIGDGNFKTTKAESPHPIYVDSVRFVSQR